MPELSRRVKRAAILFLWWIKRKKYGLKSRPFSKISAKKPILNQWDGFLIIRCLNFRLWVNLSILGLGQTHELWLTYYYSQKSEKLLILVYRSLITTDVVAIALIEKIALEILLVRRTPELKPIILHPAENKAYWNHLIARIVEEFLKERTREE